MKKLAAALTLSLCACASVPMARKDLDVRARDTTPLPDLARVYVYRPGSVMGAAVPLHVFVDDAHVGALTSSTFLVVALRPGEHSLVVRATGSAQRTLVVEAGHDYYVRASPTWGMSGANASADVVADERSAREDVARCGLVANPAAERIRKVAADLAKVAIDPVEPEALVAEATRAITAMAGAEASLARDLDDAIDRLRATRPGATHDDVTFAGVRVMLLALAPKALRTLADEGRAVDAACGLVLRSNGGAVIVAGVLPDSPAAAARVEAGLELREVEGRAIHDRLPAEVVQLLAGAAGTEVALAVGVPGEADRTIVLRRAPADASALDCRVLDERILYLRPWVLSNATARRLRDHARVAGPAAGRVILDLRDNEGRWTIDGARDLADSFVASGPLFAVSGARVAGIDQGFDATPGTSSLEEARVVVLVNGHTLGASEGVAAALQDNGRAVVLGTRTPGFAVVNYWRTAAGLQLRVPMARLTRPSREPLDGHGVMPDLVVDEALPAQAAAGAPLSDAACAGVASPASVAGDPLVARAASILLRPAPAAH
jgi:C-terminal processing protease CtpA/Prc